ncbi:metallophosphoesterase [Trichormus variabilis ARAD]|uniref:Metallophosphoesterase n=1 Tax=Trichormus variabilis N2B TaxID=2681315 RepID=A0ABR6S3B7_ANAVA|nr:MULTISPECIES: metallophosphoesterase [Nostocaceae]MBC1215002.1 metallophosphoesterase [Trichormus variabilis ARAD]MBC1258061.1 metallophosphoesterase [Trichormus variabilis V5]MBC1270277.1 metallophosphoesterase [Trichormus variabilis FSR]MBC1300904.1 metallophosphoesterase [Trichormus variabilis N2B]MBC1310144.1 metallophosphoesterase [Trichormus variabilis PNB]
MVLNFRFAVVSDLHIALPHTIWDHPSRFHLVEVGIPAFENAINHLTKLNLDFLLLPGDLTQHGEPENHRWLEERLSKLPFPTYVVPGNHDVPVVMANEQSIACADFPQYYRQFGYDNTDQLYYTQQLLPGVRLIGLNSNFFNEQGQQMGRLDAQQFQWLEEVLAAAVDELVLVMVHHNVVEHLPHQSRHPMASRYMLENAPELVRLLQRYGVKLVFTGHLHVQDVACAEGVYDITTGSLVSYPHPYRVLEFHRDQQGQEWLQILSHRVESVPEFPNLQQLSRDWMGDRSFPFLVKLLTLSPLNLPLAQAQELAPSLRDFWATIADGDAVLDYPQFPQQVRRYIQTYSAIAHTGTPTMIDNNSTLLLDRK